MIERMLPRPVRWALDRGWEFLARRVLPAVDDSLADIGGDEIEEAKAA